MLWNRGKPLKNGKGDGKRYQKGVKMVEIWGQVVLSSDRIQERRTPNNNMAISIIMWQKTLFPYFCNRLDENEQVIRFTFNNHVRDSIMLASPEKTIQLYEAYLTIGRMLRDPANQIEHKMVPGDVVTFNNSRVLHGRSAFKITEASNRYLQGFSIDWDTIYSRMRVLAKRFDIPFGL